MFTKKEMLSIPNLLCYLRILMVPAFVYSYIYVDKGNHLYSTIILLISSLTDFLDGFIARKFNMITEFGKLIDPIADKLTQFVVACILMYTYHLYGWLVLIIVLKDGMLLFIGYSIYKKTGRHLQQAELPGKIATAVFFLTSIVLVYFNIPNTVVANVMIYITLVLMIFAMVYYGYDLYVLKNEN